MKTRKRNKKAVAARRKVKDAMTSARTLAQMMGGKLTKRLTANQIARLRRALPGYVSLLDDAARQLEEDADLLNLPDVTPEGLLDAQARQKYLSAREAVAEAVYRAFYEQRLMVDDQAMAMMQKLARRIEAMKEDDPELPGRWKFLRDFLAQFRPGRPGKSAAPVAALQPSPPPLAPSI